MNSEEYKKINAAVGLYISRSVVSGIKSISSNVLKVPILPAIGNNTITLNGNTIYGSLPTGGTGKYKYVWWYGDGAGVEGFMLPGDGQNLELPSWIHSEEYEKINASVGLYISRYVKSGVESGSNILKIPLLNGNRLLPNGISNQNYFSGEEMIVYPNPTSESVNFATNFSSDKDIEIVLYSEKLGNQKSVFKGKVIPNQVVSWKIPSNYQKGIYFYKIISDNKEAKSGKIIFN